MPKSLILAKYEVNIINKNIKSDQMKLRSVVVLNYLKKYIIKNNGYLRVSIKEFNRAFSRTNFKVSDATMRKIILKLIELNLLEIDKKKVGTVYCLPKNEYNIF